jgi:hypothetical protein
MCPYVALIHKNLYFKIVQFVTYTSPIKSKHSIILSRLNLTIDLQI